MSRRSKGERYASEQAIYEEDTEALELNPAHALQVLMDQVEANAQAMVAAAADGHAPA